MSWKVEQHDTEWPYEYRSTQFDLNPDSTVLVVADMQVKLILEPVAARRPELPDRSVHG